MIEKEVQVPQGARARRGRHLQPAQGRDAARDRRDDPLRVRHPADAGDPPEPARVRLAVQLAQVSRACRRRRSRTRAWRRCRRRRTRRRSTSSSSSGRPTARATSSRRARRSSTLLARRPPVLSGATRLVGLIGDPVAHSLSPRMQNAAFAARGLDWAYVPLPVEAAAARGRDRRARGARLRGRERDDAAQDGGGRVLRRARRRGRAGRVREHARRPRRARARILDRRSRRRLGGRVRRSGPPPRRGRRGAGAATALLDAGVRTLAVRARREEPRRRSWPDCARSSRTRSCRPSSSGPTAVVNATPVRDEVPVALDGLRVVVDLAYRPDGRRHGPRRGGARGRLRDRRGRPRGARPAGRRVVRALDGDRGAC